MNAMGLCDYAARGFAAGLAAHGIGTARAFAVDPVAGTFAGIAMGLRAILSSLLIPVIVRRQNYTAGFFTAIHSPRARRRSPSRSPPRAWLRINGRGADR
jgi:hypothetical protein